MNILEQSLFGIEMSMRRVEHFGTGAAFGFLGAFVLKAGIQRFSLLAASHSLPVVGVAIATGAIVTLATHAIFNAMNIPRTNIRTLLEMSIVVLTTAAITTGFAVGFGFAATPAAALLLTASAFLLATSLVGGPSLIFNGFSKMQDAIS